MRIVDIHPDRVVLSNGANLEGVTSVSTHIDASESELVHVRMNVVLRASDILYFREMNDLSHVGAGTMSPEEYRRHTYDYFGHPMTTRIDAQPINPEATAAEAMREARELVDNLRQEAHTLEGAYDRDRWRLTSPPRIDFDRYWDTHINPFLDVGSVVGSAEGTPMTVTNVTLEGDERAATPEEEAEELQFRLASADVIIDGYPA